LTSGPLQQQSIAPLRTDQMLVLHRVYRVIVGVPCGYVWITSSEAGMHLLC
jgi:hypothetical protein